MAARPPTDDDEEQAAFVFGIAAVESRVDAADVDWPATADEILDATADPDIPYNPHGSTVRLSEILARTSPERFESRRDFLNAIHPVFEEYRRSHSGSIFGQIRSYLPF